MHQNTCGLCWGCRKTSTDIWDKYEKFCIFSYKGCGIIHSICMDCYNNNINNKLKQCINCDGCFLLDYTQLKENDKIKNGFDEFTCCYNCLKIDVKKCMGYYAGLDELENDKEIIDIYNCDTQLAEQIYEERDDIKFNNINDRIIRVIGKTIYDFNEEKNNINKKIQNCIQNDNKNLKIKGNITYEYINELLQTQNYECYICNETVLTMGYKPYCCNQFSIDRIDNEKPHNKDNVKISCYFCNCKNHYLYEKKEKLCDIDSCNCKLLN